MCVSKCSPTMVDNLNAFLGTSDKKVSKFPPIVGEVTV